MTRSSRKKARRRRVGRVSYYRHHGAWWIYYREGDRQVRRRVGEDEREAEHIAAQVNAQLTAAAPTMFSFTPISVAELRLRFLEDHECVQRSSLATVRRYRAATRHLEDFATRTGKGFHAHEIEPEGFLRYPGYVKVAPNGHPRAARRKLREKGIRYILEVCRSLYTYAAKRRHLPPYAENPFASLGGKRLRVTDAKPIFVFDADSELTFLESAEDWAFAVHFTLSKTGIRSGELVHLLVEDLNLDGGWMHIRNKPDLGWRIKTGRERVVPLVDELVLVLRHMIGPRTAGPAFLRQRFDLRNSRLASATRQELAYLISRRIAAAERRSEGILAREQEARIARQVWQEAGALRADAIRQTFIRTARSAKLMGATCPRSWRHTFATLLQDAGVDPLVRQITLGHSTHGSSDGLGMTSVYTHTRPETQRQEILRAIQRWPRSLQAARAYCEARGVF